MWITNTKESVMNFKIAKKEFLDALTLSSKAISSTTPLPALSGIKITVTENSLILVSSTWILYKSL